MDLRLVQGCSNFKANQYGILRSSRTSNIEVYQVFLFNERVTSVCSGLLNYTKLLAHLLQKKITSYCLLSWYTSKFIIIGFGTFGSFTNMWTSSQTSDSITLVNELLGWKDRMGCHVCLSLNGICREFAISLPLNLDYRTKHNKCKLVTNLLFPLPYHLTFC